MGLTVLCGHPIGRITRPVRPSVCLYVRPCVCPVRAPIKIDIDVTHGMRKWSANFQMRRSREKPPQQSGVTFTFGQLIERPLLGRRLHGGRGLKFPSITQPVITPRTAAHMSAPTSLVVTFYAVVFEIHAKNLDALAQKTKFNVKWHDHLRSGI